MIAKSIKLAAVQLTRSSLLLFILFSISSSVSSADDSPQSNSQQRISNVIQSLKATSSGKVSVSRATKSPYVSFLRTDANSPIIDISMSRLPVDRASSFLQYRKEAFVDANLPLELVKTHAESNRDRSIVRMQQMYKGVFVRGGEAVVQMNNSGITAVNSKLISGLDSVDLSPVVSQQDALAKAKNVALELYGVSNVTFSVPQLEIFNKAALNGQSGLSQLAWFIEAKGLTIREFIWIDAKTGKLIENFSQMARLHARTRATFDVLGACNLNNVTVPVLSERVLSDPNQDPDVIAAHDIAGAAYDYFEVILGRDGLADTAIPATPISIQSLVNYCDTFPSFVQPAGISLELAGWNGYQMFYATGNVVDDVVGHEYTHAVIEHSANLNLQGESGALAESFADVLGETIDLVVVTGNDVPANRWKIGEDVLGASTGPFRDLANPGLFGFPASITDTINPVYCGTDDDVFIHTNSSILSHAFVLLADGGTFNAKTITGIAVTKASIVFYEGLKLLTSNSQFKDAYNALRSAASVLSAAGTITNAEQTAVNDALDAVELNMPSPCADTQITYCPTGQVVDFIFTDDFENTASGNWVSVAGTGGIQHWDEGAGTLPSDVYSNLQPRTGTYSLYGNTAAAGEFGESSVEMADAIILPGLGSDIRMQIEHNFQFEKSQLHGGVIEYKLGGGGAWTDAGPLITQGGYTSTIKNTFSNPLAGRLAFTDYLFEDINLLPLNNYASTQLDLSSLGGQGIQFRFRVGHDNFSGERGWLIDDLSIYSCRPQVFVISQSSGLITNETGKQALFDVTLSSQPAGDVVINFSSSDVTEGVVTDPPSKTYTFTPLDWDKPHTVAVTGQDDSIVDGDISYTVTLIGSAANIGDTKFDGEQVNVSITNSDKLSTSSSGGGGGCSLSTNNRFDPMMPLLLLLSFAYLFSRSKSAARAIAYK